ncbi:MAG: acylneuraminate cytidylyltransferase family protein [Gammaproteobacteria bacterium]|jgi:N-acylneuraminate cytidylyltransferase
MNIREVLAIVPARGGSKGLPRKNIRLLNGQPLISYSVKAGMDSKYIDDVIVSSEDDEILTIAKTYGASIIKRPKELASDTASAELLIKHVLEAQLQKGVSYRYTILLQPTSPLRTSMHIDQAYEVLLSEKASSLISVVEYEYTPYKCFVIYKDNTLQGLFNNKTPFMNRQELPPCYLSNGAIYIFETEKFIRNMSFYQERCVPFIMNKSVSIDIDTYSDLKEAERLMKQEPTWQQ